MNPQKSGVLLVLGMVVGGGLGAFAYYKAMPPVEIVAEDVIESIDDAVEAPLYMTTMTHMEGIFGDDEKEQLFLRHVDTIRWTMDLFDGYGAKLTFESEKSFAKANTLWNLNIMREIVDRGHGVGTHADFGAGISKEEESWGEAEYVAAFKENKALIDALVGAENNLGISGGAGPFDWVGTAAQAGFKYRDAITGFGFLSMPLSERPEGWTDEYIRNVAYHDSIPVDFAERIRFFELANADDLVPDEDGLIVVSGGELGELASLSEGRQTCSPNCVLTAEDIQVVFDRIDEALAVRDPSEPAKINIHIPLILFTAENEELLRFFLEGVRTYVDEGKMVWATQIEAYQGYEDWKESQ